MSDQATQLRRLAEDFHRAARERRFRDYMPAGGDVPGRLLGVHPPPREPIAVRNTRPLPAPARPQPPPRPQPITLARAIAVTSGKGGVGKTNLAVNIAVTLSQLGWKVCLLDADLGLANADVLCGLNPRLTLEHVVSGRHRLVDVLQLAPGGFRLVPGASGVARMADLDGEPRRRLLEQLTMLERVVDVIVIDTAAGIGANVLAFAAAANVVAVTTTPEPAAITDAYSMIKALMARTPTAAIELVVNMAADESEGAGVFARIDRVCQSFLHRPVAFGGTIPADPGVREAVRHRVPFALFAPDSPATRAVDRLSRKLAGLRTADPDPVRCEGFFARLASFLTNPQQVFAASR